MQKKAPARGHCLTPEADAEGGPRADESAAVARWPDATNPLAEVLGRSAGRRSTIDATGPSVAFVAAWLITDATGSVQPVLWGAVAAIAAASTGGWLRWRQGERPRAVAVGLLVAVAAATVALYTGRPQDFFLLQIASNAASLVAWIASIAVRWPLLGVVVGTLLGQRTSWRRDPDLLRAYSRASWVWVAQYAIRLLVFVPLWAVDATVALGVARAVLTWPLVAGSILASWPVIRSALPPEHPGLRHPRGDEPNTAYEVGPADEFSDSTAVPRRWQTCETAGEVTLDDEGGQRG